MPFRLPFRKKPVQEKAAKEYRGRAKREFTRTVNAVRKMGKDYEEMVRLKKKINTGFKFLRKRRERKFAQLKQTFHDTHAVHAAAQQATDAHRNFLDEPNTKPILVHRPSIIRRTRGYSQLPAAVREYGHAVTASTTAKNNRALIEHAQQNKNDVSPADKEKLRKHIQRIYIDINALQPKSRVTFKKLFQPIVWHWKRIHSQVAHDQFQGELNSIADAMKNKDLSHAYKKLNQLNNKILRSAAQARTKQQTQKAPTEEVQPSTETRNPTPKPFHSRIRPDTATEFLASKRARKKTLGQKIAAPWRAIKTWYYNATMDMLGKKKKRRVREEELSDE